MPATGREGQIGFGEESTVGTAVTATRFFELLSESLVYDEERITSKGLRAGKKTENLWVAGKKGVSGSYEYEVQPNGFGIVPKHLLGGTPATTTPGGATTARLHTTKVGNLDGKSRTIQVGRPNSAGTVDPYTYRGCKVSDWEMNMEAGSDGLLTISETIDGWDEDTVTALATASYPATNVLMSWADANIVVSIGGVTTYNVSKLTLGGSNKLKGDRSKLGSPVKLEQLEGTEFREYPGTIELESYAGLTPYNLFKAGTEAVIIATFTGPIIEAALRYMIRVTLQRCRFDGTTPNIAGPDIIGQTIPFKALYTTNANTEVMIEVQNTDVAA